MSGNGSRQAAKTRTRKEAEQRRYLLAALPLGAILVAAMTLTLCFLPEIRLSLAWRAYHLGDYSTALAAAENLDAAELANECRYWQAVERREAGEYAEAAALFDRITTHRNAKTLAMDCRYLAARIAETAGDYQDALAAYQSLSGYSDSLDAAERCRLALAELQYRDGDLSGAIGAYLAIGNQKAMERAGEIAMQLSGIDDPNAALNVFLGLGAEDLAQLAALMELRADLPVGVLDTGFFHTVGVAEDGKALACGDNRYGQCDVTDWSDLQYVAAGAFHTVGLRTDGTVLSCGDNRYGQCDVADWQNVRCIAVGDYDTAALTADGTILYTGYHDYAETSLWPKDLTQLSAGSFSIGALRENGGALCTASSGDVSGFSKLVGLWIQTGYAVGLEQAGSVQTSGVTLPAWEGVLTLSVSATRVLALLSDQTVAEFVFREEDRLDLSGERDVVALAAGAVHAAVLHADGSVRCFGQNELGQCNTTDWTLRTNLLLFHEKKK